MWFEKNKNKSKTSTSKISPKFYDQNLTQQVKKLYGHKKELSLPGIHSKFDNTRKSLPEKLSKCKYYFPHERKIPK